MIKSEIKNIVQKHLNVNDKEIIDGVTEFFMWCKDNNVTSTDQLNICHSCGLMRFRCKCKDCNCINCRTN